MMESQDLKKNQFPVEATVPDFVIRWISFLSFFRTVVKGLIKTSSETYRVTYVMQLSDLK